MKNHINNSVEATELIIKVLQFEDESVLTIICTLIDMVSERRKESAGYIADVICSAVHVKHWKHPNQTTEEGL